MPVQHEIWKVGDSPAALPTAVLVSEQQLEDMIVASPEMLSGEWMLIGRQEHTAMGGRIDLLAIAPDASLVLIELKRNRTPREVVAQALDYASWVEGLSADRLAKMYQSFSKGGNLGDDFRAKFGTELDEDELNASHQIIIVAAELDGSTERIISYLNARDIAINVVFFQVFQHGAEQLLSRAWLIDPGETQENVATSGGKVKGAKEPWNGEFYASFGYLPHRSWEDAQKYGYICAGGGAWYTQTLNLLSPGDRVWVNIPNTGYVGVGIVREPVQTADQFMVETAEGPRPCLEVLEHAELYRKRLETEKAEHFVGVDWLDTVPVGKAFNEVGLFGNQNTVCRPKTTKWRHTVDQLKTRFTRWDAKG